MLGINIKDEQSKNNPDISVTLIVYLSKCFSSDEIPSKEKVFKN